MAAHQQHKNQKRTLRGRNAASITSAPGDNTEQQQQQQRRRTIMADPSSNEEPIIGVTATKASREDAAGIGFRKQVRKCSEHIYVSRMSDDSIFSGSDLLSVGDEVVSVVVPVAAMDAVEVSRLVNDSEGYVTIAAERKTTKKGKGKKSKSKSSRLLRRGGGGGDSSEYVTATAHKTYRTTEAGVGFRRCVRGSRETIVVADIEEDSIFAADADAGLQVDDEVVSVEVGADGRTANEVADLVRGSAGDVTLYVIPQYAPVSSTSRQESEHFKGANLSSSSSRFKLFGRKKTSHISPAVGSTNTGLTVGTVETIEE